MTLVVVVLLLLLLMMRMVMMILKIEHYPRWTVISCLEIITVPTCLSPRLNG